MVGKFKDRRLCALDRVALSLMRWILAGEGGRV